MYLCQEVILELNVIKAKVQKGEKPLKDIEELIHKIEGMNVENLRVLSDLELIIDEIVSLKEKYKIIDKVE